MEALRALYPPPTSAAVSVPVVVGDGRGDRVDNETVQGALHALVAYRARGVDEGPPVALHTQLAADASQSSAAVERSRKARRRRGNAPRTTVSTTRFDTPTLAAGAAAAAGPSASEVPIVVEDFAALYRDFDQVRAALKPDLTTASGRAGAERKHNSHEPHPRHAVHRENPEARPWLVDEFRYLLSRLPVPRFSLLLDGPAGGAWDDAAAIHTALREGREDRRLLLPLLRASHESLLLAEAGTFPRDGRRVTYPPCRWGQQCVGVTEQIRGLPPGGVVLTALLFPEEYETLLSSGRVPNTPRPCVLCYRYHAMDYVLTLEPNFTRVGGVHPGVVQCYRNLVDEPEGYFLECVLMPSTVHFEGFVDPIATFRRSFLCGARDPTQGQRWVVDQSSMCVPAAAKPTTLPGPPGTRLEHF